MWKYTANQMAKNWIWSKFHGHSSAGWWKNDDKWINPKVNLNMYYTVPLPTLMSLMLKLQQTPFQIIVMLKLMQNNSITRSHNSQGLLLTWKQKLNKSCAQSTNICLYYLPSAWAKLVFQLMKTCYGYCWTPVQCNAIQCNGPAINETFVKRVMVNFCWD